MPYATKSSTLPKKPRRDFPNGGLKGQSFSPIKKDGIIFASTPDLSISSKSDDSPGSSNMRTSTPELKGKRRTAPPPPKRPAVPKALFTEGKTDNQVGSSGLALRNPVPTARAKPSQTVIPTPAVRSSTAQVVPPIKPNQKKRPAPPRPSRPPPPQPSRQSSTDSKDSRGSDDSSDGRRDVNTQFKQDGGMASPTQVSLDLELLPCDYQDEGGKGWRGAPIFIPPPPPDELPPPLDECETPVGPLTDFEADILEGDRTFLFTCTSGQLERFSLVCLSNVIHYHGHHFLSCANFNYGVCTSSQFKALQLVK